MSEHKIGMNTLTIPDFAFCFNETKSTPRGTGFFINGKYLYTKRSDLNIILDKYLESTFIEINLPKERIFLCDCIYIHLHMSIADFNLIISLF